MVFFNLLNVLPALLLQQLPSSCADLQIPLSLLFEITGGIVTAGKAHPQNDPGLFYSLAGISCIAQTLSMISGTDLSIRSYVLHKLCQSGLAIIYYQIIFMIFAPGYGITHNSQAALFQDTVTGALWVARSY